KSAQIREILISESAWEEMTCLFAPSLGLAPSCSSTAVLVVGDAVALALSELKQFTRTDFGLFHPGGALGVKANS
ncbi:hypothetical protein MRO53_22560, partial [Escherichia coli]|nr:hypothetical protein [Escherichia coli]